MKEDTRKFIEKSIEGLMPAGVRFMQYRRANGREYINDMVQIRTVICPSMLCLEVDNISEAMELMQFITAQCKLNQKEEEEEEQAKWTRIEIQVDAQNNKWTHNLFCNSPKCQEEASKLYDAADLLGLKANRILVTFYGKCYKCGMDVK